MSKNITKLMIEELAKKLRECNVGRGWSIQALAGCIATPIGIRLLFSTHRPGETSELVVSAYALLLQIQWTSPRLLDQLAHCISSFTPHSSCLLHAFVICSMFCWLLCICLPWCCVHIFLVVHSVFFSFDPHSSLHQHMLCPQTPLYEWHHFLFITLSCE